MTLDQLRVFVAVAEREHLTQAARALNLTPSAVSASIQALEQRYGVDFFHRVGRRIELSDDGRSFLADARVALGSAQIAEAALRELGGLERGALKLAASQTLTSYWLPPAIVAFASAHPAIDIAVTEGNTTTVPMAVLCGACEIGFIEGAIDEPALAVTPVYDDRLVVVAAADHPLTGRKLENADLAEARWVMRERGSGTRSEFECAIAEAGLDPRRLNILVELPTNEAVCAAALSGGCVTVVSDLVARAHVAAGRLCELGYALPPRQFSMLRHKERKATKAGSAFEALLRAGRRGDPSASSPSPRNSGFVGPSAVIPGRRSRTRNR